MRVISGKFKGRNLIGFDIDGTRPTMDRVKESVFGMIQEYVKNSVVLDLFAGSGSLGIEALSNGANEVTFVDNNKELIEIIKKNTNGMENIILIKNDYLNALDLFKQKFDIIFLDPPYKSNLIHSSIEKILKKDLINKNGIIVCEYEQECLDDINLNILKEKKYGSKNIKIFKV